MVSVVDVLGAGLRTVVAVMVLAPAGETRNPPFAFSSAAGGRDVENTPADVRPSLRVGPSRPKPWGRARALLPEFGRDNAPLVGGGRNRFGCGVLTHRAFRLGGNVAQSIRMNKEEAPALPASNDLKAAWNLPPTTMIGTRPTVVLTYSLEKAIQRELEEEAQVAKLGFWGRLLYKLSGGPRRYQ